MKSHTKYFFFKIRALIVWIGLFLICSSSTVKAIPLGAGDSIANSSVLNFSALEQRGLIQSMNKKQLNQLVDYLFDMDTIPSNLINEINLAILNLKKDENKKTLPNSNVQSSFPAADIYVSWEIDNLFPEKDMLKMKGDTSVTLILEGNERGNYFHPFNGPVTSGFGWRDSSQHNGIDIDLNKGDKVVAAFDGMVRVARNYGGFGNVVIVRHYNGLETVYAHLSKIKVKSGQVIVAGQLVGLGGSTGHSTGSHLHFEVRF